MNSVDSQDESASATFGELADVALKTLDIKFGTAELEKVDKVLLMDGWNKILGWETMWKEAMWMRWRHIVVREALLSPTDCDAYQRVHSTLKLVSDKLTFDQANAEARRVVDRNEDPIAIAFGDRSFQGKNLLLALFDDQIRELCPHHQVVQREAYRAVTDDRGSAFGITLECKSSKEIFRLFSNMGISPEQYMLMCEAFLWTMESHNPYIGEEDEEDMSKPKQECVYARFVANIARLGIEDGLALREKYQQPIYREILPHFWEWVKAQKEDFGEHFYNNLLSNYPELLDFFARADMDSLAGHIVLAIDLMIKSSTMVGEPESQFRQVVSHLGEVHRELGIPTDAYPSIGMNYVGSLKKFLEVYPTLELKWKVSAEEIQKGIVDLYTHITSFTFYPMMQEEMLIKKATEFFETVAEELDWSNAKLSKRLLQVKLEINATGTYHHTSEEIELGARLCWRNSVKCIGRISWNTLLVRDCRHVVTAGGIIKEIENHLKLATAGTNLQSVMSVFRPKGPKENWGIKFWSDQLVRYACYTNDDGTTMGDLANKGITKYLIEQELWTPPEPRTQHDVLPVVFKLPGQDQPVVHQFDPKYVDEADIFHPEYPEVAKLGHKWAAVPAINTFNMNLGGVEYGCMPFNGWFCSVEIVRDLMERYEGASEKWAKAIGIDIKKQKMWKARVAHEIDVAVLHSFEKANYTIVDPETVGEQFMTHCKRERDSGRECPAQWSWIGGLTGPTNKTWHKEMRDFRKDPQYEYCAEMWSVTGFDEIFDHEAAQRKKTAETPEDAENMKIPRVLIAFGSETGTAEAAAARLGRAMRALKPTIAPLNDVAGLDIAKMKRITHVLVLCSTFGKGNPPTCAKSFFETEIPSGLLADTKVATLALGSTMYPDFCQAGKKVEKLLLAAGGQKLAPITYADEAVDSPGTVAQWIAMIKNTVLPASLEVVIQEKMGAKQEPLKYVLKFQVQENVPGKVQQFKWNESESSVCVKHEELLVDGDISCRSTRRIGFKVPPNSTYTTGDHLCVQPLNSLKVVTRFASCFLDELKGIDSKKTAGMSDEDCVHWCLQQSFHIDCIDNGDVYPAQQCFTTPTTLAEALQSKVGLSLSEGGVADVLNAVAGYLDFDCDDEVLVQFKSLSATILEGGKGEEAREAMTNFLSLYPTLVDLLGAICPIVKKHNSAKQISLAYLLPMLPKLQPRLYSISSSSTVSPDIVEISVGVVHTTTDDGVKIAGVCSNYLANLTPTQDCANVSIRTSSFRGPEDLVNTPMILVGAGTGLAPMMGFLHDRAFAMKQAGQGPNDTHLFFGCRTHKERIYRDLLEEWESENCLNLHLALSRDNDLPKMYVQDQIRAQGKMLCDLIMKDNCRYYVCGDARMADFCYEAIVEILREHGHMSRAKAVQLLKRLRVEDRWQYDLWGISAYMDEGSYSDAKKKTAKKNGNKALAWLAKLNKTDNEEW